LDAPRVGGETQAYCTHCKVMGEHVVVAMVGPRPAKVECATCHKQHLYRSGPPGSTAAKAPRAARKKDLAEPPPPPVDIEALVAGRPSKPYDPKTRFAVGEVVRHPTFGLGLVTMLPGPQKVEIAFPSGAKLLSHDRTTTSPGLERPPKRDDEDRKWVTDAPPPRSK